MSVKNLLRHVYFLKQKKLKLKFVVNKYYKTPLGETGCLGNLYFIYWLPKHPVFWFILTLTQSVRPPMVTYPSLCSTCVTYGTLCHARGHQVLPAPDFSSLTCDLRDAMPRQRSLTHSRQVLPTPSFLPQLLTSSLTLPWAIARFLDPFYTFSPAHRRVIRDFVLTPT